MAKRDYQIVLILRQNSISVRLYLYLSRIGDKNEWSHDKLLGIFLSQEWFPLVWRNVSLTLTPHLSIWWPIFLGTSSMWEEVTHHLTCISYLPFSLLASYISLPPSQGLVKGSLSYKGYSSYHHKIIDYIWSEIQSINRNRVFILAIYAAYMSTLVTKSLY